MGEQVHQQRRIKKNGKHESPNVNVFIQMAFSRSRECIKVILFWLYLVCVFCFTHVVCKQKRKTINRRRRRSKKKPPSRNTRNQSYAIASFASNKQLWNRYQIAGIRASIDRSIFINLCHMRWALQLSLFRLMPFYHHLSDTKSLIAADDLCG